MKFSSSDLQLRALRHRVTC